MHRSLLRPYTVCTDPSLEVSVISGPGNTLFTQASFEGREL